MKCNSKVLVKIAVGLGLALAVAYLVLPEARAVLLVSAPFLAALICPIAMLIMMAGMTQNKKGENAKPNENEAETGVHPSSADKA